MHAMSRRLTMLASGTIMFLAGMAALEGAVGGRSVAELKAQLRGALDPSRREAVLRSIADRLDETIGTVLVRRGANPRFEAELEALWDREGVESPFEVRRADNQRGDMTCFAYNLPQGRHGEGTRVFVRLATPTGLPGSQWILSPMNDSARKFRRISHYPIYKIEYWQAAPGTFVVLRGHLGMGMGQEALSVWDAAGRKCIWAHELAFSETCEVTLTPDELGLTILHGDAVEEGVRSTWIEEAYGWNDGALRLKRSKVVREEVHEPAWDPNRKPGSR